MGFWNQNRQSQWGIDFDIITFEKKRTESLHQVGTLPQALGGKHVELFFYPGDVGARPGINLDFIALLDKRRHLELKAGLNGHGFGV